MSGGPMARAIWRGLAMVLLGAVLAWGGCATPQERYRVLSFFFDGVPDPNPKPPATQVADADIDTGSNRMLTMSRHKPYADNKCSACHRSASGGMMDFEGAYKTCTNCHKTVRTAKPRMHGPVATGACEWCHAPHTSPYPALLKDDPVKVCSTCHDAQLLGPNPPEHADGKTSCISCHYGHGGTAANFLKPKDQAPWPASTQPRSTQPAGAPGTAPATSPAASRPGPLAWAVDARLPAAEGNR